MVAARRGIAVLQNHQSEGSSSVSGRMWMRHFGFLWWEEREKRRRWGGRAGEYLEVEGSALLLLLGGEMESVVVAVVIVCIGFCSSYIHIVAGRVPWVWDVETDKHFGGAQEVMWVADGTCKPWRSVLIN